MSDLIILTQSDKEWLKTAFRQTGHCKTLMPADFEQMKKQADEYVRFFSYINSLPEKDDMEWLKPIIQNNPRFASMSEVELQNIKKNCVVLIEMMKAFNQD